MVTILLTLLIIRMTIYSALAAKLEGRTAHHVNLLAPTSDDTAARITCPVYSIRPENKTVKFTKYTARQVQYDMILDWDEKPDAQTFKECATLAATEEAKMFLFDDGLCSTSDTLFTRLSEPCGDETATFVYMAEPGENDCAGEYIWIKDGGSGIGDLCGLTNINVSCSNGMILTGVSNSVNYVRTEGGCISIHPASGIAHNVHANQCKESSCTPADEASRPAFLQIIKSVAGILNYKSGISEFMIDCKYAGSPNDFFLYGNDVIQNYDVSSEWKSGFPTNPDTLEFVYGTTEGLMNGDGADSSYYCCYKAD